MAEIEKQQQILQRQIKSDAVRWIRSDQMHLTLKFFGNIPAPEIGNVEGALRRACQGAAPFWLESGNAGWFPEDRNPRVLWVGLGGDLGLLGELQKRLDEATQAWGDHREDRAFHPHLTIGRVKEAPSAVGRRIREVIQAIAPAERRRFQVERVLLMQSRLSPKGAEYSVLATIPLERSEEMPG